MPSANEVIIAAAGSGKTRRLVQEALADRDARVLVTTYTRENLAEIDARLWVGAGVQPTKVATMTWFEFLLRDCVKPYQSYRTEILSIRSVNFISENPPFTKRSNFDTYYLDKASNVYSDAVADLACILNEASGGKVIKRLESAYDLILIDEMQDLAGWDLEFAELLLNSQLRVILVGDPRQAVYSTNRSPKNKQYRGAGIVEWVNKRVSADQCTQSSLITNFRCNPSICNLADGLYPHLDGMTSGNLSEVEASGVHFVHKSNVDVYRDRYAPQALRWDKRNKAAGPDALNLGEVKGREFPRVLIYPTVPILAYLEGGEALKDRSLARFYVGVTRAQHSVGIVTDKKTTKSSLTYWEPA